MTINFTGPASYVTVDLIAIKGANVAASPPPPMTFDGDADVPVENDSVPGNANPAQDPGFFTTVSSNGAQNAVIWAVARPVGSSPNVTLYAFDPVAAAQGSSTLIFSAVAGSWPNTGANANIVPVVANGRVYVASYKQLAIFGLGSGPAATLTLTAAPLDPTQLGPNQHEIHGTIQTLSGYMLTVATLSGAQVDVDATQAVQTYQSVVLSVGEAVRMLGSYDASNVFHATTITQAKGSAGLWPPDR